MIAALLLEGPAHKVMCGWRHFLIVTKGRRASVLGMNGSGPKFAKDLRAEFYAAGTWEDENDCVRAAAAGRFSAVRVEILSRLDHAAQLEMAV